MNFDIPFQDLSTQTSYYNHRHSIISKLAVLLIKKKKTPLPLTNQVALACGASNKNNSLPLKNEVNISFEILNFGIITLAADILCTWKHSISHFLECLRIEYPHYFSKQLYSPFLHFQFNFASISRYLLLFFKWLHLCPHSTHAVHVKTGKSWRAGKF